LGRRDLQ
jgi:hypothetical protein